MDYVRSNLFASLPSELSSIFLQHDMQITLDHGAKKKILEYKVMAEIVPRNQEQP